MEKPYERDIMVCRARKSGDLENALGETARRYGIQIKEMTNQGTDYAFRVFLPRKVVAEAMYEQVMNNHAHNFKATVREDDRHDAYMDVWTVMNNFQRGKYARGYRRSEMKYRGKPMI